MEIKVEFLEVRRTGLLLGMAGSDSSLVLEVPRFMSAHGWNGKYQRDQKLPTLFVQSIYAKM